LRGKSDALNCTTIPWLLPENISSEATIDLKNNKRVKNKRLPFHKKQTPDA